MVVVFAIGLAAFLSGGGASEVTETDYPDTTAGPTTVPDGQPGPFVGAAEWQLVTADHGGFTGTAWFGGAVATESGFVAWSTDDGAGTLWHSADGISWSETHREAGAFFGDVVETQSGFLAVGQSPCGGETCAFAPTIWVSPDGTAWDTSYRFEEPDPGRACCGFSAVEPLGSRLVAFVGDVTYGSGGIMSAGCGPSACSVSSWTSDDGGATWSRHPFSEGQATVTDLVAAGPGLIAVGDTWGGGLPTPTIWASADGETWTAVEPPGGSADVRGSIGRVAAAGSGVVAVGHLDESAAVWTSGDGVEWTVASAVVSITGRLLDVAALPSGSVVAVGYNCDPAVAEFTDPRTGEISMQCGAGVWNSPDGVSWVRAPYEESVFLGGDSGFAEMQAVAAGPGGVLALGRIGTDDEAAAVWIGTTSMITPN